jgi:hypothetical protein
VGARLEAGLIGRLLAPGCSVMTFAPLAIVLASVPAVQELLLGEGAAPGAPQP